MSRDDLDPELRALIDAQSGFSDMPADAPAKIFARVRKGLGLPPTDGGAGGGQEPGAAPVSSPQVGTTSGQGFFGAVRRTPTLVAFGTGIVIGAVGHAVFEQAPVPAAPSTLPASTHAIVPLPSAVPSSAASIATVPPPSSSTTPSANVFSRPKSDDESEDRELAVERAQLEMARTALARGRPQVALAVLQADAARHPKSRLAEERDSLTVQSLALSGRSSEARAAAAAFATRHPKSLFLPVVQAAVGEEPQ